MQLVYLLSYHGTIVGRSRETGQIAAMTLRDSALDMDALGCWLDLGQMLYLGDETTSSFSSNRYFIEPRDNSRTVSLKRADRFLRVSPDGVVDWHANSAEEWEEFVLLSQRDLEALKRLMCNNWVRPRMKALLRKTSIRVEENFKLRIGDDLCDISLSFPLVQVKESTDILIFIGGWQVDKLILFRPLIYYVSFGAAKQLKMAAVSIMSWCRFHDIDVTFLIITDLTKPEVLALMPAEVRNCVKVWNLPAEGNFEYFVRRYQICDWEYISNYQPILYIDTDILFDNNIDSALIDILVSDKICVALESNTHLNKDDSVGRQLYVINPFDLKDARGFNSGALGIPSAAPHRADLTAVVEVMTRYALSAENGRRALAWLDQPCANYALVKIDAVSNILTDWMSFVGHDLVMPSQPRGFIHIWGGSNKLGTMQAYLGSLDAEPMRKKGAGE